MAKIFGHDSQYIRRLRRNYFIKWLLLLLAALATVVVMVNSLRLLRTHPLIDVVLIVGALSLVLWVIFQYRDVEEDGFISAFRGLRGEDDIFRLLQQLSDTYSVYRGLQFREHNDTDFVVVGPTGVFTIEVKSHAESLATTGTARRTITGCLGRRTSCPKPCLRRWMCMLSYMRRLDLKCSSFRSLSSPAHTPGYTSARRNSKVFT